MDNPTPSPAQPASRLIFILGIVAGIGGIMLAAWIFISNDLVPASNKNTPANTQSSVVENINTTVIANVPIVKVPKGRVTWNEPRQIDNLRLLGSNDYYNYDDAASPAYYDVGTVNEGDYAGWKVVLLSFQEEGPSFYPEFYRILRSDDGRVALLTRESSGGWDQSYYQETIERLEKQGVTIDWNTTFEDLDQWPSEINVVQPRVLLVRDASVNTFWKSDGLKPLYKDPVYGQAYTAESVPFTADDDETLIGWRGVNSRNGIYFRAADGTMRVYYMYPEFMDKSDDSNLTYAGETSITWSSGEQNSVEYELSTFTGCGAINYANVIPEGAYDVNSDLEQIGATSTGDPVYQQQDRDSQRLHEYYDTTYTLYGEEGKVSFETFAADHPIIYWIDPFGRMIELTSTKYRIAAECGKPVIYLYPNEPTKVNVQLHPVGGLRVSDPEYGNGWNVLAQPNGRLTDLRTGKQYPYLFWEGSGGIYQTPEQGFVVPQAGVHEFLVESLTKLGLNATETKDFIEFWEPRMQGSPYYFVTFMGNRVMDELAPLDITPKPDTVIRILMDFLPLEQPIDVSGYRLHAPERKGFTVIEWGGVVR